jgi:hypothetical protein
MEENKASDLEARVKGFNEKLIPLLAEFKLGLGAIPLILGDGRVAARPHLFDDTKKEEPKVENKEEVKPDIATA